MINSLRSGVTGLRSHQTRMDVIGNNIANVNTAGFKRSRVTFHEVMAELKLGVGRMAGGRGVNPAYVGRGVSVGSIDQDWSQGSLEYTNIATDLALVGDGFFVVGDGKKNMLTRSGDFTFNSEGQLVTSGGLNVKGWAMDGSGSIDMSQLRDVQVDFMTQAPTAPKYTDSMKVAGNLSAGSSDPITISTVAYDEQGNPHNVVIKFTNSTGSPNTWDYEISPDPADLFGGTPPAGTVEFDVNGQLKTVDGTAVDPADPATAIVDLTWDTNYVSSTPNTLSLNFNELTQFSGSTTASVSDNSGYGAGQFLGYSIGPEGLVTLNYSNGEQVPVFQLAVGNVSNPNGLEQMGDNLYGLNNAAGDLVLGRPGTEVETSIVAGALEGSNVDLSTEFTDMIVTQRGYQASARVITTSDELLQEIVQLKR